MILLSSLLTFAKLSFSNNSFRKTIRMSICLDPDQDRHFVGPDQGPNRGYQQMTKVAASKERVEYGMCELQRKQVIF